MTTLLEIVRTALRRKTTALDETELIPMIQAAKQDLAQAGVGVVVEHDPLTRQAIRLYCLAKIEHDPSIQADYDATKNAMALDSRYRGDDDAEKFETLGC